MNLPSIQTAKLIGLGVAALCIAFGSYWITAEIYQGRIAALKLGYKQAETDAVNAAKEIQAKQFGVAMASAIKEAESQQKIVTVTQVITKEIPIHVSNNSKCPVTVGFLRVLDGAVHGVSPSDLPLAPGQSDDTCAAIDPRTLALNIVENYRFCVANSNQLTNLQQWVRDAGKASQDPRRKK